MFISYAYLFILYYILTPFYFMFCFNNITRQSEPEILYAAAFDTTFNAHVVTVSEIMQNPNSSHRCGNDYSVWLSAGAEQCRVI